MQEVVILSASRTPIGSFGGALSSIGAPRLGSIAISDTLKKSHIDKNIIDEVLMGNALQAGLGQAPARQAAYFADLPHHIVCTTIHKVCASGMKAITLGAASIKCGDNEVVIAGGMESMSNAPYYLSRKTHRLGDLKLVDGLVYDGLTNVYDGQHMGYCAQNLGFSRKQQDEYATRSYKLSAQAWHDGKFEDEIVPVNDVFEDEEYKKVDFAKLQKLKPIFSKNGTITAANASTINDGASALVLASSHKAQALGLKPIARIIAYADYEQAPEDFGKSPAGAIKKALKKANLSLDEVDFFEINEAFSAVALVNIKLLNLDINKVNVNGGAVSLGHPLGSSGCRIVVSLLSILKQNQGKIGVASICNGGGGASAIVVALL